MIRQFAASLVGWYADGRGLPIVEFMAVLDIATTTYAAIGAGSPGQSARIILAELDLFVLPDTPERSEEFATSIAEALKSASSFLSTIKSSGIAKARVAGVSVDVYVEVWMDNNQFDLEFPPSLLGELGRLHLPLRVLSND